MGDLTGYAYFLENALKYGWMVPRGVIMIWSGLIANIPAGWAFCDGQDGRPDLRNRFVVGAKQDVAGDPQTDITGPWTLSGGTLAHLHGVDGNGHSHEAGDAGHLHGMSYDVGAAAGNDVYAWAYGDWSDTAYADIYINDAYITGTANYTDTLPPYWAFAYIIKT